MKLTVLKCSKSFFHDELVELIVHEKTRSTKIQARSFFRLRFRMLDWKPVTNKDEMYVVLAIFMLMGIIQKPTLRSYLKKIVFWRLQSLVVIFMDRFESICNVMHFTNNDSSNGLLIVTLGLST